MKYQTLYQPHVLEISASASTPSYYRAAPNHITSRLETDRSSGDCLRDQPAWCHLRSAAVRFHVITYSPSARSNVRRRRRQRDINASHESSYREAGLQAASGGQRQLFISVFSTLRARYSCSVVNLADTDGWNQQLGKTSTPDVILRIRAVVVRMAAALSTSMQKNYLTSYEGLRFRTEWTRGLRSRTATATTSSAVRQRPPEIPEVGHNEQENGTPRSGLGLTRLLRRPRVWRGHQSAMNVDCSPPQKNILMSLIPAVRCLHYTSGEPIYARESNSDIACPFS